MEISEMGSSEFKLYEALLWVPESGYYLLEEHLNRLADSATYFDFFFSKNQLLARLQASEKEMLPEGAKVKLYLDKDGAIDIEIGSLGGVKSDNLTVGLAANPVDSQNPFLYHKTTVRAVYDQARQSWPECDDVILWNEKNEVTESCRSNVVVEMGGELLTPPISCGLLGGTFRGYLLQSGEIKEKVIPVRDLKSAENIYTINSVRKWMTTTLIDPKRHT